MRPRFTLQITLRDNHTSEQLAMAIDMDHVPRISSRSVEEVKIGLSTFNNAVSLMKQRNFRKDLFRYEAERLGVLLSERMEDAEGWHDTSRIDPARKQLGGKWE